MATTTDKDHCRQTLTGAKVAHIDREAGSKQSATASVMIEEPVIKSNKVVEQNDKPTLRK